MDAMQALITRRCVRRFQLKPVPSDLVEQIVDAGRLAPTARNVQPCEYVVVTDAGRRSEIAEITDHGKFIDEAPVCIVVLSKPTKYYLEDGSAAVTNLLNAAHAIGLGACWVAGDKKPYAEQILNLCGVPQEMRLIALVPIGYPDEIPTVEKRELSDVINWETYGHKTP